MPKRTYHGRIDKRLNYVEMNIENRLDNVKAQRSRLPLLP